MSDYFDKIDPQLAEAFPREAPNLLEMMKGDINMVRSFMKEQRKNLAVDNSSFEGSKEEYHIAGLVDNPEVRVVEFSQRDMLHPDCVIIWLHGGGYLIGDADDAMAEDFCPLCPVVSVDYRLAPENRAPAAAYDICAVIEHIAATRKPKKIILAGASAGGGLAASSAIMNRDRNGPKIDFQLLYYPMIDDQHDTQSGHMDIPLSLWNREMSLYAWSVYSEIEGISEYAAAARASDLSNLPPAYIMSGDMDLFLDEDVNFATRLREANVPVELAIFPNAPHGFNAFAPKANVSVRAAASIRHAAEHALARE